MSIHFCYGVKHKNNRLGVCTERTQQTRSVPVVGRNAGDHIMTVGNRGAATLVASSLLQSSFRSRSSLRRTSSARGDSFVFGFCRTNQDRSVSVVRCMSMVNHSLPRLKRMDSTNPMVESIRCLFHVYSIYLNFPSFQLDAFRF